MAELATNAVTPYGIDGRELGVLLALAGGEPASQHQAAQRLGIDRTTMVAMLDALEGKGLLSRHPHAKDRRRNVIELTDAGRDTLRLAIDASDKAEREFLTPFTSKAAEHLRTSLQKLVLPSDD